MNQKEMLLFPNVNELAGFTAIWLREKIARMPEGHFFTIALSGGSTPKKIFDYISSHDKGETEWSKVRFFWGDERCVPPDHDDSNYKMAKLNLLDKLEIQDNQVFRIYGEDDPRKEAIRYEKVITEKVKTEDGFPRFDLVILGLGTDGHTASIFPGNTRLFDSDSVCEAVVHPQSGQQRITITGSVINNAENVFFIVTGADKAEMISKLWQGDNNSGFPASLVNPTRGNLKWLLDAEAAGKL